MRLPSISPARTVSAALHATIVSVALLTPPSGLAAGPTELLVPPAWVVTENGVELQRMTDANTKLTDKDAKRLFEAGLRLATAGADEETQQLDLGKLSKAEDKFSQLIDELVPSYACTPKQWLKP